LVTSLVLDVQHLGSLLLDRSDLQLLGLLRSLLLSCSNLQLLGLLRNVRPRRPYSGHLLLALVMQRLKKGLLSVLGGQSALQTKTTIKYIKWESIK
jgi:hypothetical protein